MEKHRQFFSTLLTVMKIAGPPLFIVLLTFSLGVAKDVYSQELLKRRMSIDVSNEEFRNVLSRIEKTADVKFSFVPQLISVHEKVSVSAQGETLASVLDEVLSPLKISYEVSGKYIVLKKNVISLPTTLVLPRPMIEGSTVRGKVTDVKGELLIGTTVFLNQTRNQIVDQEGMFVFNNVLDGKYTIQFTSVGFKSLKKEIDVKGGDLRLDIVMMEDNLQLDQVVVTSGGSPKKKIESSVAVTTISAKQLTQRPPLNSTDMLKAIPGLSVESSGGDGPGSVRVRGLPGGGYVFMGVMEDGLPVLPTGFTTSPSADQYYKVDLTVKNVEAVRGGNASVILANTPGALINVLSNTGGETFGGKVKYTRGLSQNANRVDLNLGGPLSSKVKFNVGGFYRGDAGIRPPSYRANEGGQLKMNLTYQIKPNSYIRFYGKYLNDKTTWLVPAYYSYDGSGQGRALPGFDPLTEILATRDTKVDLTGPDGKKRSYDFADGVHLKSVSGGMEFKHTTSGEWTFKNSMRYQSTKGGFVGAVVTSPSTYKSSVKYYYPGGQELVNPTGYYTGQNFTGTTTRDNQFVDILDIGKQIGRHSLSFGGAFHSYDVNTYTLGATFYTEIKDKPHTLLIGDNKGNGYSGVNIANYRDGLTTISSVTVSDEINLGKLTTDLGLRVDRFHVKGNRLQNVAPFTNVTAFDESNTYFTGSLGLNYKVNDEHALFARATKTYSALNINDYSNFNFNPETVKDRGVFMAEGGYKVNTSRFALFSSLIYARLTNIASTMAIPNTTAGFINIGTFASSRNLSAEIEAIYTPSKMLNFRLTTTFQNSKYTKYEVTAPENAREDLAGKPYIWSGNNAERIPSYIIELSASYTYKVFDAFLSFRQIGKRYTSPSNVYRLNGYNEISAGLDCKITKAIGLRVWADNLANSRGLTEGNIRGDQFLANGAFEKGSLQIGRVILPRSFWTALTISF